ncbi:hypothetical protein ACFY93_14075 [Streptomyces sp. NPDC008313]|uniref:hypothetical protein n=1 Tax=Streptomyces sp. NPDC008313 TaxID=3364826 RepID=UPI0036E07648
MTYQETFPSPPADLGDEAEHAVRQYDALIEKSQAAIATLNAALREESEKCEALITHRNEAQGLVGMQSRLWAMHERAREHGIFTAQPAPPVTLRIVPDPQLREPSVSDRQPSAPTESSPWPTDAGPPSAEIIIRSKKQQEILNIIASRHDIAWGSEDIAKILGIPKEDPRGRKRLRNCLRALTLVGAVERITREDDRHVYYRPRMNWKFD